MPASDDNEPQVKRLLIYPVKGCAGQPCESVEVQARGLAWDRRWMLVDGEGRFLSQRQLPALALIQARVVGEELVLSHPGFDAQAVLPTTPPSSAPRVRVTIWRDECEAVRLPDAGRWASEVLGRRCELVFMPADVRRPVNPAFASSPGQIVGFADAFPILLVGEASLADLNTRLDVPVPVERFRPNLIVSTPVAFAEDGWGELEVGSARLCGVKASDRCTVTTVDQRTGEPRGPEPIRTLAGYRRFGGGKVFFGQNLTVHRPGQIHVGDRVHVLGQIPSVYGP